MPTPIQRTRTQASVRAERCQRVALCDLHDSVRQVLESWKRRNLDEQSDDLLPVLEAAQVAYEGACRASDEAKELERQAWNGGFEQPTHRILRSRFVLDMLPGREG